MTGGIEMRMGITSEGFLVPTEWYRGGNGVVTEVVAVLAGRA